jgi:hypothetical protein
MRNHHVRLPRDLLPWQHVLLGSSSSSRPSSAAFTTQALPTAYGSPVPPPLSRTVSPLPAPKASIGSLPPPHTHTPPLHSPRSSLSSDGLSSVVWAGASAKNKEASSVQKKLRNELNGSGCRLGHRAQRHWAGLAAAGPPFPSA